MEGYGTVFGRTINHIILPLIVIMLRTFLEVLEDQKF